MMETKRPSVVLLTLKDVYKDSEMITFKHMNLEVCVGEQVSIECRPEEVTLLLDLILGFEKCTRGNIIAPERPNIRCIYHEDPLYYHETVEHYLILFEKIFQVKNRVPVVMEALGLLDVSHKRITKLNKAQQKRVSLAREYLSPPQCLLIQEPLMHMDQDSMEMMAAVLINMREGGTSIIALTSRLKDALLMGETIYYIESGEMVRSNHDKEVGFSSDPIVFHKDLEGQQEGQDHQQEKEQVQEQEHQGNEEDDLPLVAPLNLKIIKIPAKLDDRILLFEPSEVDYIEVINSVSIISVRGDRFTCSLTLTEIEERLIHLGFFRSHRSYLVNLQRVREVMTFSRTSFSLVLDDKPQSNIPLSKGRYQNLKERLGIQ